jgi:hypothetical protein
MSHNQKRATMNTDLPGAEDDAVVERFPSTSGRIPAVICLATAGIVLVLAIWPRDTGTPLGVALVAGFAIVLIWVVMLRAAVMVTAHDLVLRNMLLTFRIPLAAINKVVITQVLAIYAGEKRYVSPAIGYTLRQTVRSRAPRRRSDDEKVVGHTAQDFVEERIRYHMREARERQRIVEGSPEQLALAERVRRSPAWPEIAGLVALAVAYLVWLVL